jgi:hypothetical protein
MVAFSASQKERLTIKRIVELYAIGEISTSTHAWREGMDKWVTLFEIDAIATELRGAGYLPVIGARVREEDDDATRVGRQLPPMDDEDMTQVAGRAPVPKVGVPEDDDATQVFRPAELKGELEKANSMAEDNLDSVTRVASAGMPPDLPPEVPKDRPPSVPPPRRISLPPVNVPIAEVLLEPTSTLSLSHTVLTKHKRRSPVLWAFLLLTLAAALVLVVLYITGRWPLVTRVTAELKDNLIHVASR